MTSSRLGRQQSARITNCLIRYQRSLACYVTLRQLEYMVKTIKLFRETRARMVRSQTSLIFGSRRSERDKFNPLVVLRRHAGLE